MILSHRLTLGVCHILGLSLIRDIGFRFFISFNKKKL